MRLIDAHELKKRLDRLPPEIRVAAKKAVDCTKTVKVPSAQPEIIRCKDCKHRDPEDKKCDSGHAILWQLPRQDDWYCADAEWRTQ